MVSFTTSHLASSLGGVLTRRHFLCPCVVVCVKQVVAFEDFKAHNNNQPSMAGAKAAGKYRIEGKNYEVKDGDIVSSLKGMIGRCV